MSYIKSLSFSFEMYYDNKNSHLCVAPVQELTPLNGISTHW